MVQIEPQFAFSIISHHKLNIIIINENNKSSIEDI